MDQIELPTDWRVLPKLLYGSDWIAPVAEVLGISRRTLERYRDGVSPIPEDIEGMLRSDPLMSVSHKSLGHVLRNVAAGKSVADLRRDAEEALDAISTYELMLEVGHPLGLRAASTQANVSHRRR